MLKKIKNKKTYILFLFISFFISKNAFALELDYPSFIPINDATTFGELVAVIYGASLIFGAFLAFSAIIYTGIIFIFSGNNPARRKQATEMVKKIIIGLIILFFAWFILGLIDADLTEIREPNPSEIPIFSVDRWTAPSGAQPETGMPFTELALGKELTKTDRILNELNRELLPLLDEMELLFSQCSSDLCTPGSGNYSQHTGFEDCEPCLQYDCTDTCMPDSCASFDFDGNCVEDLCATEECIPNSTCLEFSQCPVCEPTLCEANECIGDPIPTRPEAQDSFLSVANSLNEFNNKYLDLARERIKINGCISSITENIFTCSSTSFLVEDLSTCEESKDYFCSEFGFASPSSFSKISLPIQALIEKEDDLIEILTTIVGSLQLSSCTNTDWECGDANLECSSSTAVGACAWAPTEQLGRAIILAQKYKEDGTFSRALKLLKNIEKSVTLVPKTANAQVASCVGQLDGTWCWYTDATGSYKYGPAKCAEDLGGLCSSPDGVCMNEYACKGGICSIPADGALVNDTCASASTEGLTCTNSAYISSCVSLPGPGTCSESPDDGLDPERGSICTSSEGISSPDTCIPAFKSSGEYECNAGVCNFTQILCPAGTECLAGNDRCTPIAGRNGTGCPPPLHDDLLPKLADIVGRLRENSNNLKSITAAINSAGQAQSTSGGGGIFLYICADAKAKMGASSEDGTYAPGTYCGPDAAARTLINTCLDVDFYLCG